MKNLLTMLKGGITLFYLVALASPFVPALAPYSTTLLIIVGVLLVSHIGEYIAVRKRLAQASSASENHFVSVLLFGFVHWLPLLKSAPRVSSQ